MLRRRNRPDGEDRVRKHDPPSPEPDGGHFQALDHMAQWVRFADVKATVLFAVLGAVFTMVVSSREDIAGAARSGGASAWAVVGLGAALAVVLVYAVWQLLTAVNPQSTTTNAALNRFAWPTLLNASVDELVSHSAATDPSREAWAQALDLAGIASKKYAATRRAARGVGVTLLLAVVLVTVAVSVGVETSVEPEPIAPARGGPG